MYDPPFFTFSGFDRSDTTFQSSATHSHTFPTMLYTSYLFCGPYVSIGHVDTCPSSAVFFVGKVPVQMFALYGDSCQREPHG